MTASYVILVLDRYDGEGNPLVRGTATLTPSMDMPDPADRMIIGEVPLTLTFRSGSLPSRRLASTDSVGPQSNGWTWNLAYDSSVPGTPAPASYYIPAGPAAFTATNASPAVFTWTPTASLTVLPNGTGVQLSGGSLPAPFAAGTTYYVVNVNGTAFGLAAAQGGSPLASSSSGSGSLTVTQYNLSALASTPAAQPGQQYLPLPSGTPAAGNVPVATGTGEASAWGSPGGGTVTSVNGQDPDGSGNITLTAAEVGADTSGAAAATASSRLLNDRGAIAASTAYNPGDMVAYRGQRVLITTTTTSSAWPNWFTPPALTNGTYIPITSDALYYAADWGVVADGVTDNGPALNRALQFMSKGINSGGFLLLPPGYSPAGAVCGISSTVIIPPGCIIAGSGGLEASCIRLNPGANCDVVQFQTNGSAAQAAILSAAEGITISGGSLRNCFYGGLMNLTLHGNNSSQAATSYNYGVSIITNPISTAAGNDPDFDPYNILLNVEVRSCTGDGLFHNGRGGLRVTNCLFRYNTGCGAITGTDSLYVGCNFGQNGIGGAYVPHSSCDGAANKSYNNGSNLQWVSGHAYAALTPVMYNGALYRSINAVTSSTPPASDATNWAHLSAAQAPQAWGIGFYFDNNFERHWTACDAQENSASDYYLRNTSNIVVQGVSGSPGFGLASNPNDYASVVLDNAAGCIVDVSFGTLANLVYVLRVVNGSTRNDVRMAGDTSYPAILSPDSITLLGSGNSVKVNGATLTDTLSGLADVLVSSLTDSQVLAWNATASRWENTAGGGGGGPSLDTNAAHFQPDGAQAAGGNGLSSDSGHVHPENLPWTASDSGYLAWNFDIGTALGGNSAAANGVVNLIRVNVRRAVTVSNVALYIFTQGSGLVANENFAGLYNSAGTLIASTADQSAAWASTGLKTMALAGGPYSLPPGFYWVAVLANQSAGATPAFVRAASISSTIQNVGVAASGDRWATNGSGTSLPASVTPASNSISSLTFWAALS